MREVYDEQILHINGSVIIRFQSHAFMLFAMNTESFKLPLQTKSTGFHIFAIIFSQPFKYNWEGKSNWQNKLKTNIVPLL